MLVLFASSTTAVAATNRRAAPHSFGKQKQNKKNNSSSNPRNSHTKLVRASDSPGRSPNSVQKRVITSYKKTLPKDNQSFRPCRVSEISVATAKKSTGRKLSSSDAVKDRRDRTPSKQIVVCQSVSQSLCTYSFSEEGEREAENLRRN